MNPSTVTYCLSGRQRKELLERGRPLSIAIPAPDTEDYDALAFAGAALPDVEDGWFAREEKDVAVIVDPIARKGVGLQAAVGEILHANDPAFARWRVSLLAVVAAALGCRVRNLTPE